MHHKSYEQRLAEHDMRQDQQEDDLVNYLCIRGHNGRRHIRSYAELLAGRYYRYRRYLDGKYGWN